MPGQVQRQLFHRGLCSAQHAAQTLLSAIQTSVANEHDLRLPGLLSHFYAVQEYVPCFVDV